jgi:biofilm PGA synthesis protein PgaD
MTSPAHEQPQIQAPELQSAPDRTRDMVVTAIMWAVYMYLWAPLVSLFAWLLGFEFAYDVMIRNGGASGLDSVLRFYALVVVLIFLVVSTWSLGNRLRYGKLSRRRSANETTLESMAEYFEVDADTATRLRGLKLAAVDFDAEGRPVVSLHEPPRPGPGPESPQFRGSEAANTPTRARQSQP